MKNTSYSIETRSIVKTYQSDFGVIQAVDDVSLQVSPGAHVRCSVLARQDPRVRPPSSVPTTADERVARSA